MNGNGRGTISSQDIGVFAKGLVKDTYLQQGVQGIRSRRNALKTLLTTRSMPEEGLDDMTIEIILSEFAAMDSNNFMGNCGLGEREGRVFSSLVMRRHFNLSHGIGRSGDLQEEQPKAAGSSILYKLTSYLTLHAMNILGLTSMRKCLVVPMATGMSLALCQQSLKAKRPNPDAKYVIWSRIDQKSCFKSILTAGLIPIIVDCIHTDDLVETDVARIESLIHEMGAQNIVCIFTTTSCFAPRAPDAVDKVGQLCKQYDIPHVINNAYGLQCRKTCKLINRAVTIGRVDYIISSTDKNFMVPVGGGIIASPDPDLITAVGKLYPGRASITPILDLFITLLSMGQVGLTSLVDTRETLLVKLKDGLSETMSEVNEKILVCERNTISIAATLDTLTASTADNHESSIKDSTNASTFLGSMLFQRGVSGTRIVNQNDVKSINGYEFRGWGASTANFKNVYFTTACSIGLKQTEIDVFLKRLRKVFGEFKKKRNMKKQDSDGSNFGNATGHGIASLSKTELKDSQNQAVELLKGMSIK